VLENHQRIAGARILDARTGFRRLAETNSSSCVISPNRITSAR
jgi:hypothetical protein